MQEQLEKRLTRRIIARRWAYAIGILLWLALFIVSWFLLETTKDGNNYNMDLIYPLSFGLVGTFYTAGSLILDFIRLGYRVIQKDQQHITIYRGSFHRIVYVDGKEKRRIDPFEFTDTVEVWLDNRVRITVTFSRSMWYMAHISFSDNSTSIEL